MEAVRTQAQPVNAAALDAGKAIRAARADAEWPTEHWWEALHDSQLNRIVDNALEQQPTLKAAQARTPGRSTGRHHAPPCRAWMPVPAPTANATRPIAPYRLRWQATMRGKPAPPSASYDLDLWGRNRQALAAALDEVQIASAEAQLARLTLASTIVRNYVQLSLQYALHDSAEQSLAQRQRLLDISRQRHKAGLASELDVRSMETTLAAGRRELEQIEESMALLRNQLAALSGKGPGDGDTIARPVCTQSGHDGALPAQLPAELLGHRPDIVAQRWRIEAASARIGVAQAAFYPNINLSAFAGLQSLGFSHLLDGHSAMAGVTPAISLPLFEGGRLRSQLQEQGALYDGAVEQYNASIVQALAEVANALVRINSVHGSRRWPVRQ
jgi:NodT family efflux transporter outer membrane factor (OMF) lipoprotein